MYRKEKSSYDANDIWPDNEKAVFLKYCDDKRIKCYVAMCHDASGRPLELLTLRIKDIQIQKSLDGKKRYSLLPINSYKTGQRTLPLYDSIPYIVELLKEHPCPGNPDAYLFVSKAGRNFGERLTTRALRQAMQKKYKPRFRKLLVDPKVPDEDKELIRKLLKRPWNPYFQRHIGLTIKAREKGLSPAEYCQYGGWTLGSKMPEVYQHLFGSESAIDILKSRGITVGTNEDDAKLTNKPCPSCGVENTMHAKVCYGCGFIMSSEGYQEVKREDEAIRDQLDELRRTVANILEKNKPGQDSTPPKSEAKKGTKEQEDDAGHSPQN